MVWTPLLSLAVTMSLFAPSPDGDPPRRRVEWIELDADGPGGPSGRLLATPEFLDADAVVYHFGENACGRPMSKRVLDALVGAMRDKTPVSFEARPRRRAESTIACIESIRLHAS